LQRESTNTVFKEEEIVKDLKNRLDLLELDLKKLEKKLREEGSCGTAEEWHHVLQKARKIEEFAITQLAVKKFAEDQTSVKKA
jgi:pyruvate-formate lyase-activating enzyme